MLFFHLGENVQQGHEAWYDVEELDGAFQKIIIAIWQSDLNKNRHTNYIRDTNKLRLEKLVKNVAMFSIAAHAQS